MSLARPLVAALLLLFFAAAAPVRAAAPSFPALTGRVVDAAHILPAPLVSELDAKLAALEQKTSRQLVVVTIPSLQGYEIEEYGYRLGRAWGVGQKQLNNGVLLIVAPNERRVRIEVGYGLEPLLTDALSNVILQTQVLPRFKAGDMAGGVRAGADAIIEQLSLDPSEAERRVAAAAAQARERASDQSAPDPFSLIITLVLVFFLLRAFLGGRRRRGIGGVLIPPIIFGGGGGGWRGRSGGGFGGGGFSGGGGSFGGGGSSGSW